MKFVTASEFKENHRQYDGFNEYDEKLDETVLAIIRTVRKEKDQAVLAYTEQFDGAKLTNLMVSSEEFEQAYEQVTPEFIQAMQNAHENIKTFHLEQKEQSWFMTQENQVLLGQKVTALPSVGIYVPGGKAAYPSTVLMNATPAKIAGVQQVVMTTPPQADGTINPHVLVAAQIAGVDTIYKTGGAQAIAALAYGTETIPKVAKIVGPGNAFVARAKKWVYGDVAIDMIAGPSEICIVADQQTNPAFAAADLLSQAEHDEQATAVCITTDAAFAKALEGELSKQLQQLPRQAIAEASIQANGQIILVDSLDEAFEIVNLLAPEHLQIMLENAMDYLPAIEHAGAIFLGQYSPEALGDYYAGTNHTLPTSGTATFSSPLGVYDFLKKSSIISYSKAALQVAAADIMTIANAEGLTGHAYSIEVRKDEKHA